MSLGLIEPRRMRVGHNMENENPRGPHLGITQVIVRIAFEIMHDEPGFDICVRRALYLYIERCSRFDVMLPAGRRPCSDGDSVNSDINSVIEVAERARQSYASGYCLDV